MGTNVEDIEKGEEEAEEEFDSSKAVPSLERVPQVPRHPLRYGNRCQAPVLIRA